MTLPAVDRRTLLIGGGAGVGLVVGFLAWPRREGTALRPGRNDRLVNLYLRVAKDGRVTLAVPQTETGQGIWTGLAQIAADELGAKWEQMAVEPAPYDPAFANTVFSGETGLSGRVTAGGTSIRAFEEPVRHAAAIARDLLCRAAADRWNVKAAECDAKDGVVIHEGKAMAFGEVAEAAAALTPLSEPVLRPVGSGALAGQPLPRLDLPAKSDGTFRFASDVRLPSMLFASARIAPTGGRIVGFDQGAAKAQQGCRGMLVRDGWVAALGDSWWAAEQALVKGNVARSGPRDDDSSRLGERMAARMIDGPVERLFEQGDYENAIEGSRPLSATYSLAPLPHRSLEPPCAVARLGGDRLELWLPTQAADAARAAALAASGLPDRQVTIYPMPVGDGSGAAFDTALIPIAIDLAKASNRPVSLTLSPEEAQHLDRARSPLLASMAALPSPAGGIAAWRARLVGRPGIESQLSDAPAFRPRGGVPPYGIPAIRVDAIDAGGPIEGGYWRGGSEAALAFATECFVDEMARAAGMEPFAYRLAMLGGAPRLARVLTTVTAIGGWDGGAPGSSMGLACASLQGSHVALLVTANLGANQAVEVSKMTVAVDCGRIVNPNLVRQQVEGGLLAALAAATLPAPERVGGLFRAEPMRGRPFGRLDKVPPIEIELIDSKDASGGVSGLGMAVLAPALANALFAATGRRLRNLPFDPMASP